MRFKASNFQQQPWLTFLSADKINWYGTEDKVAFSVVGG